MISGSELEVQQDDKERVFSQESSFNCSKREKFTVEFETDMWHFLLRKLKDEHYLPAKKPAGLLLWRDFIMEKKSKRSAMNLATHFRKTMRANIMYTELSNDDIMFIYNQLKWTLGEREDALLQQRSSQFPLPDPRVVKRRILVSENDESGYGMGAAAGNQVQNGVKRMRIPKTEVLNDISSSNESNVPMLVCQDPTSNKTDEPNRRKSKLEDAILKLREKAGLPPNKNFNVTECAADEVDEPEVLEGTTTQPETPVSVSYSTPRLLGPTDVDDSSATPVSDCVPKKRRSRARPKKATVINDFLDSLVEKTSLNLTNSLASSSISVMGSNKDNFVVEDFESGTGEEITISDETIEVIKAIYRRVNGPDAKFDENLLTKAKTSKGFKQLNYLVNNCTAFLRNRKARSQAGIALDSAVSTNFNDLINQFQGVEPTNTEPQSVNMDDILNQPDPVADNEKAPSDVSDKERDPNNHTPDIPQDNEGGFEKQGVDDADKETNTPCVANGDNDKNEDSTTNGASPIVETESVAEQQETPAPEANKKQSPEKMKTATPAIVSNFETFETQLSLPYI